MYYRQGKKKKSDFFYELQTTFTYLRKLQSNQKVTEDWFVSKALFFKFV